jgi:hypothetical protein
LRREIVAIRLSSALAERREQAPRMIAIGCHSRPVHASRVSAREPVAPNSQWGIHMPTPSEHMFDTFTGYRQALLEIVQLASQTIVVVDPDLRNTGLEFAAGIAALEAFCARTRHENALRIVVHSPGFIEKEAPRLLALAGRMQHRLRIRLSSAACRNWDQPFLVADEHHLVMRFHEDGPRGKTCLDDIRSASAMSAQFETIWLDAGPGPSGAPLGI